MNAKCDHPGSMDMMYMDDIDDFMLAVTRSFLTEIDKTNVRFRLADVAVSIERPINRKYNLQTVCTIWHKHRALYIIHVHFSEFIPEYETIPIQLSFISVSKIMNQWPHTLQTMTPEQASEYFQTLSPQRRSVLMISKKHKSQPVEIWIMLLNMLGE